MDKINLNDYGYIRVASVSPTLKIGNPDYNSIKIIEQVEQAESYKINILTFPELSLTGYTCGDLFNQPQLLNKSLVALRSILKATSRYNVFFTIGIPIAFKNKIYNCAVAIYKGKIMGIVPKTFIPNYGEFYEQRWFSPAFDETKTISFCEQICNFGKNILFKVNNATVGIEICEDLWVPNPPHIEQCLNGANIILNLSASNEIVGKSIYRENLVKQTSANCICGYVYCSSGQTESTTDIVFSGHNMIAENGGILSSSKYELDKIIYADIDIDKLMSDRRKMNTYSNVNNNYLIKETGYFDYMEDCDLERKINPAPFVPKYSTDRDMRCEEIFNIQTYGLIQRINHTGIQKVVIGISGGLDSTLALLVCYEAMKKLNLPTSNIIGITMPGFGTTSKTLNNSLDLMKELDITSKIVDIKNACDVHFSDIGHDKNILDVTYENVQARERTQILMDFANKAGALVIGTGDLSELALGWCTYNGDHMSMYAVNSSVPKTLVKYLVEWYAEKIEEDRLDYGEALDSFDYEYTKAHDLLIDIVKTKISPELLPPDENGEIAQVTEDKIGPYELHDFFLYNMLRCSYSPKKIYLLARMAFNKYSDKKILKWMEVFYRRFFAQQFKRTCIPGGPKVGTISLSPRGDWRMPDDASAEIWLDEIKQMVNDEED